jgi:putative ABC transport system permease protein
MAPLDRKVLRDLWRIKGLVLAISLVMATGIATYVMSLSTLHGLIETRIAYYERHRFAEVFANVKRAPQALAERIAAIPGVKAVETRIVEDVILDVPGLSVPATGRVISLPEHGSSVLNVIAIRQGRSVTIGRPDEVVVSEAFAEAHGFVPGDRFSAILNGHKRRLQIVGVALSPEYVYSIAPGSPMPDDKRFGVLWMGRDALEAAFDLKGAFNDISLSLLRGVQPEAVIRRLDALLDRYGSTGAIARADQPSNWFLQSDIDQLAIMTRLLPTIFLVVSAFLLHMVISRLIETEREEIGLLKAFGYSDLAVGWHYLKMVSVIYLLALALGAAGGAWLGRANTELYGEFYRFPFLFFRVDFDIIASAALVGLVAALAGTLTSIRRAVRLAPAVAMQPPAPPLYRPGLLRRFGLARAFDQPTLMILRHLARWPLRSALTAGGIAAAVAVLLMALQWLDAVEHMVEVSFEDMQHQDVTVNLAEATTASEAHGFKTLPGVLAVEPFRNLAVRFRAGHRSHLESLNGVRPDAWLVPVRDASGRHVAVPASGLLLSTALAKLLHVRVGDLVTVEVLEGRRSKTDVPVTATFETYFGTPAYMHIAAVNRLMLEGPTISGAHLLTDARSEATLMEELKSLPRIAGVSLRRAVIRSFRDIMAETMNVIVSIYVGFGCLLASGVVYNSLRISLSERGRELASLRVLGFTRGEVSYILLGELALLMAVALPVGCLMGYGLSWLLTSLMETELYRIPLVINRSSYVFAIVVVAVAGLGSGLLLRRRIDRFDLIAVLKTRD